MLRLVSIQLPVPTQLRKLEGQRAFFPFKMEPQYLAHSHRPRGRSHCHPKRSQVSSLAILQASHESVHVEDTHVRG